MHLLYLSSLLPKRSETFVYREVLGLRDLGVRVSVASLYAPERQLGDPRLDALADEVITVYPAGLGRLLADATAFGAAHPMRAAGVKFRAIQDAVTAKDVSPAGRPKIFVQALAGLALAHRLRDRGITHLHVHLAHAPATVGMYAAQALDVPFSFTGHAADLFRDRALLLPKLERAAFVACISEWNREWYQSLVPRDPNDYPVIRCGVGVPANPTARIPDGKFRMLALGRLVPKKGFDLLPSAVSKLRAAGVPVHCVVAGDGPERIRLEATVADNGTAGDFEFLGDVCNGDVPGLIAGADVMVLPCRVDASGDRDGIPVVLMEAMAQGLCVVGGDLPTIRELIQSGQSGFLIGQTEMGKLASVLEDLYRNPEKRLAAGLEGRRRVMDEFSSATNLARLREAFQKKAS